ncbi:MAG: hypothetical protein WCH75_00115, partial [Candidatus Binatia bacterium]
MIAKRNRKVMVLALSLVTLSLSVPARAGGFLRGTNDAWGSRYNTRAERHPERRRPPRHGVDPIARLHHWNEIAINASGLDHTPVTSGEHRVFGEQYGPTRA